MKMSDTRRRERAMTLLGVYLFVAPWVFGTSEDKVSSANARIAGACLVVAALRAPMMPGPLALGLTNITLGAWLLASPFVLSFAGSVAAWSVWIAGALIVALADTLSLTFDFLSWHIVECSYQIRRTLLERTSEVEVGMCVLGYRACVNDSTTLDHLIDKELPESGLLRRLRLKIARRQAVRSLSLVREVLPPGAPHVWHRSRL